MKSIYILGKTKGDEREDVRHKLENKKYDVVVASNIWKEGVNIKSLGCVINAAGWKSEKVVMQKLGRGMRTAEGKIDLYYFDFLDTGNKHLAYHALKRLAFYIRKGWEIIKY
jgi:superfamily II DNA or RNA helicase